MGVRAKLVNPAEQRVESILLSRDPAMLPLLRQVQTASQTTSNVVIHGESGTGKELVARALHELGPRRSGPFVAINCGAFTETLLESELFGHTKGSFTDAHADKVGHIVAANGGTLFLDEIGDAPLSIQVRLLRVIQEREVLPVGSRTPVKVDVRLVAATHRDLKALVADGRFRDDLFYRLNVLPFRVPALRERKEDVMYLAEVFMKKLAAERGCEAKPFSADAVAAASHYTWPGNVRELQNRVEHALVMGASGEITARDLFPEGETQARNADVIPLRLVEQSDQVPTLPTFREAKDAFERSYADALLRQAKGNVALAARIAGKSRTDVYHLIRKFNLDPDSYRNG